MELAEITPQLSPFLVLFRSSGFCVRARLIFSLDRERFDAKEFITTESRFFWAESEFFGVCFGAVFLCVYASVNFSSIAYHIVVRVYVFPAQECCLS
jgi:hypothetical protein